MREKAGNPIGPPKSNIVIPTWGPNSNTRLENDTTVRINFKIRDGDIWETSSTHLSERSDSSEFEKVAMKWVRENWRLFNHEECKRKRSQPAGGSCMYS